MGHDKNIKWKSGHIKHVCADMSPFYIYSHESRQNKECKHILSFRRFTLATASKKYFLKMVTAEK